MQTTPCARKECWINPFSQSRNKSLEAIGNALQQQYNNLQNRAVYRQLLDPTVDELRKLTQSLRRRARSDRLLFHYNGTVLGAKCPTTTPTTTLAPTLAHALATAQSPPAARHTDNRAHRRYPCPSP